MPYDDVRAFIFPSGLTVLFARDAKQPTVAIHTYHQVGSGQDPVGEEGMAHYVEHLWFRSKQQEMPSVWDGLSQMGCSFYNAATTRDTTQYMTFCPSDVLPQLLQLEAKRLKSPLLGVTQEELDIERDVVRNEKMMRMDSSAFGQALPLLSRRLYPEGHVYHAPIAGTDSSLDAISLDGAAAFMEEHYTPENTTIAVVGDIDLDKSSQLLFENMELDLFHEDLTPEDFSKVPAPNVEDPDEDDPDDWINWPYDPEKRDGETYLNAGGTLELRVGSGEAPPEPVSTEWHTVALETKKPMALMAWSLPGTTGKNESVLDKVTSVVTALLVDAIPKEMWTSAGTMSRPSCFMEKGVFASTLICGVEFDGAKNQERVIGRLLDGVDQRWGNPNAYLEPASPRVKSRRGDVATFAEDPISLAGRLSYVAHRLGLADPTLSWTLPFAHRDRDASVLLKELVTSERAVVVRVEPGPPAPPPPVRDLHGSPDAGMPSLGMSVDLLSDEALAKAPVLPDLSKLEVRTLENGLRLVTLPYGENNFSAVRMTMGSPVDSRALDMVAERVRISRRRTGRAVGGLRSSLRGHSANLSVALKQVETSTGTKTVPAPKRILRSIAEREAVMQLLALRGWRYRELIRLLDPEQHIWERRDLAWVEERAALKRKEVQDYVKAKYDPANKALFVVGPTPAHQVAKLVEQRFGDEESSVPATIHPPLAVEFPEARARLFFDSSTANQSQVGAVCVLPLATTARDFLAREVLQVLVNERVSSLRTVEGVTYGASASTLINARGAGVLEALSMVHPDATAHGIRFLEEAFEALEQGTITDEEVRRAAWIVGRRTALDFRTSSGVARALTTLHERGQPESDLGKMGQLLVELDGSLLEETVKGCNARRVSVVTGRTSDVQEQLDSFTDLPFETVDWKERGLVEIEAFDPRLARLVRKNMED